MEAGMLRRIAIALTLLATPVLADPAAIKGLAQVIDGDTITVEGTAPRIRLAYIDAPESTQPGYDADNKRYLCGSRAAEALAEIVGRNGRVSCTETDRDRYGRIVAVCFVGTVDINREMVRRGWAVEYKKYSDGRYAQDEAEAKAAKRGLWVRRFDEPATWRHSAKAGQLFALAGAAGASESSDATTSATSCKSAHTCRDAVILWCGGYSRADADGDGIPCENVCRTLKQVDALKKGAGCIE
jgi:endonuclease YncB( thermonuclease family)